MALRGTVDWACLVDGVRRSVEPVRGPVGARQHRRDAGHLPVVDGMLGPHGDGQRWTHVAGPRVRTRTFLPLSPTTPTLASVAQHALPGGVLLHAAAITRHFAPGQLQNQLDQAGHHEVDHRTAPLCAMGRQPKKRREQVLPVLWENLCNCSKTWRVLGGVDAVLVDRMESAASLRGCSVAAATRHPWSRHPLAMGGEGQLSKIGGTVL